MVARLSPLQQEGSLCAQHCLNALLQNNLFSAPDLGEIAHRLDERERETMAEGGINTYDYQRFLEVSWPFLGVPGGFLLYHCC